MNCMPKRFGLIISQKGRGSTFLFTIIKSLNLATELLRLTQSMLHPAYVPGGSMLPERTRLRRVLGPSTPTNISACHIVVVVQ